MTVYYHNVGVTLKSLHLIKWNGGEYRLINKVSLKWESSGFQLGIEPDLLEAWWREDLHDSRKCWLRVMKYWLSNEGPPDYPPTWDGLYLLLEDVEYSEVVKGLKEAVSHLI